MGAVNHKARGTVRILHRWLGGAVAGSADDAYNQKNARTGFAPSAIVQRQHSWQLVVLVCS